MKNIEQIIEKINRQLPTFVGLLGGKLVDIDTEKNLVHLNSILAKTIVIPLMLYKVDLLLPC